MTLCCLQAWTFRQLASIKLYLLKNNRRFHSGIVLVVITCFVSWDEERLTFKFIILIFYSWVVFFSVLGHIFFSFFGPVLILKWEGHLNFFPTSHSANHSGSAELWIRLTSSSLWVKCCFVQCNVLKMLSSFSLLRALWQKLQFSVHDLVTYFLGPALNLKWDGHRKVFFIIILIRQSTMGLSSSSLWVKCCFLDVMLLKLTLSYFPWESIWEEIHF